MNEKRRLVGKEIKRLDNEIHSRIAMFRTESGDQELTMMQGLIIGFIYRNKDKDLFQKDIESEFSIARSTATGILQLMEKKGYLSRKSVTKDARLKKIILTEQGILLHEKAISFIRNLEDQLMTGISEEELDLFFSILSRMRSNIEGGKTETDRRRNGC